MGIRYGPILLVRNYVDNFGRPKPAITVPLDGAITNVGHEVLPHAATAGKGFNSTDIPSWKQLGIESFKASSHCHEKCDRHKKTYDGHDHGLIPLADGHKVDRQGKRCS